MCSDSVGGCSSEEKIAPIWNCSKLFLWISLSNQFFWKTTLTSHDASRDVYSHCIYLLFVFLKRLASPAVERRCAYSPNPDRGRKATTRHRQERRGRDQTAENKENIAVQDKDVDIFALPPPRTPVSSKKNARPNKNVLTTPNQNANGTKTKAVTPKGKMSLSVTQPVAVMKCRQCRISVRRAVYLYTIIVYCSKQGLWSTISIWLFALANWPSSRCSLSFICPSLCLMQLS